MREFRPVLPNWTERMVSLAGFSYSYSYFQSCIRGAFNFIFFASSRKLKKKTHWIKSEGSFLWFWNDLVWIILNHRAQVDNWLSDNRVSGPRKSYPSYFSVSFSRCILEFYCSLVLSNITGNFRGIPTEFSRVFFLVLSNLLFLVQSKITGKLLRGKLFIHMSIIILSGNILQWQGTWQPWFLRRMGNFLPVVTTSVCTAR